MKTASTQAKPQGAQRFSITFKDFHEGASPAAHLDDLTEQGGAGSYSAATDVDVLTPKILTQGPALATLTNGDQAGAVGELINHIIDLPVSDGFTYGIAATKLHQISPTAVTDAGIWPHTISSAVNGSSTIEFQGYVYYFYNTASYGIMADAVAATDVLTITSPSTLAETGITSATPITYTGATHGGLVQGTTYYVGSISGNTFKLYTDVGLTSLVDITSDIGGVPFLTSSTGGDCGRWDKVTTFTDNYISGHATAEGQLQNAPHPVATKQDIMLFGNGRYAGTFVSSTSTVNTARLDFGPNAQVADVVFHANQWWIAVNTGVSIGTNRTFSEIFLYDGSATTSILADEVAVGIQKIGFLLPINGVMYVCYQDVSGSYAIGYVSSRRLIPLVNFTGSLPTFQQKTLYKNFIVFPSGGLIHASGASIPALPYAISEYASGGYTTVGAVAAPFGTLMVASTQSTSFKLASVSGFSTASTWRSIIVPLIKESMVGTIDAVIVRTTNLATDAKCLLSLEYNQAQATSATNAITGQNKRRHRFVNFSLPPEKIEDFRVLLDWSEGSASVDCAIKSVTVVGSYISKA